MSADRSSPPSPETPLESAAVFDREALEESLEQIITNAEAIAGDSWNEPHPNLIHAIRQETIIIRTLFSVAEETSRRQASPRSSLTAPTEETND